MTADDRAVPEQPTPAADRMRALRDQKAAESAGTRNPNLSDAANTYLERLFQLSPGHAAPDCRDAVKPDCDCAPPEDVPSTISSDWIKETCGQLGSLLIEVKADRIKNSLKYQRYTPEPGYRLQILREVILLMAQGHIGGQAFWTEIIRELGIRRDEFQVVDAALTELAGLEAPKMLRVPHGQKHPNKAMAKKGAPGVACCGRSCGGRMQADVEKMKAVFDSEWSSHAALDAVYAVPRRGRQVGRAVFEVDPKAISAFGKRLASLAYEKLGQYPGAEKINACATLIQGQAVRRLDETNVHPELLPVRATTYRDGYLIDLGDRGGNYVYVTDAGWRVVRWHEDFPVMLASQRPLPIPVPATGNDVRRKHLGFAEDDPNWHMIRIWHATAFFSDHERQMMLLTGGSGSGKTKRAESIAYVVDPLDTDSNGNPVMGGPLPDDEALAPQLLRNYLFTSDNLTTLKPEDSDRLCRITTGYHFVRRVLYTTSDLYTVVVRRPGLLTGIEVPPQLQEDAQNRMLHLELDDNAPKRPSAEIVAERIEMGPEMLGELLDDMVTVFKAWKSGEYRREERFPIVWCAAKAFGGAYEETLINRRSNLARVRATGDNYLQAVAQVVKYAGIEVDNKRVLMLDAPEWVAAVNATLEDGGRHKPTGWATSGQGFGARLGRNKDTVKALGLSVEHPRTKGQRFTAVIYTPGAETVQVLPPRAGLPAEPFLSVDAEHIRESIREKTRERLGITGPDDPKSPQSAPTTPSASTMASPAQFAGDDLASRLTGNEAA